jgi:alpha-galactosidase
MMQNRKFYTADADCAGIRGEVPWDLNRKWLYALAHSGSPLFVSLKPGICTKEQLDEIRKAYAVNSVQKDVLAPLNWTDDACPSEWLLNGKQTRFNWYDGLGAHGFSPAL